jgi:hypothetical protein
MAEVIRETPVATNTTDPDVDANGREHSITVAERVIYLLGGVLLTLLGIRFLLMLLGANPSNGFANFIYDVSHPFVAPFFGLFSYQEQFGASKFEFETLIAMVVYGALTLILARIVALPSRRSR